MPLKVNPATCCLDMVMGPGTGTATVKIAVDDNTAPGTNPVLPTGAGQVTIVGAAVAAHSIPIETHSRAANTFNIEVQVGSAVTGAPGNTDAAGLVQFDDTTFSVDANGYVTLVGGGMAIDTFTTDVAGPVSPDGAGAVDVTGTSVFSDGTVANTLTLNVQATANTILYGAGAGTTALELGPLTDGQMIIGSTGLAPVAGTMTVTTVANATNATPIFIDVGAGTLNIDLQVAAAITGAPANANNAGICSFDDTAFSVDANGYVTLAGGGAAVDSFITDINGPVAPDGAGAVTITGTSVFSNGAVANTITLNVQATANTFLLGAGSSTTATELGPLTNGQLIIGSTGLAPSLGNITSTDGSITVTNGAGTIDLAVAAADDAILTLTGDTGGALSPTAGNINILGGPGVTVTGSGSTLTVNSVVYTDQTSSTLAVDSGTFATAAGAYTLPASPTDGELVEIVCITTGIVVTANTGQEIQIAGDVTSTAGTATNSAKGDVLCLRYRSTDTAWYATSALGVWTLA